MERKYVMQLPRGAKVSSTDVSYEDGKIVLTAQLEEWKPQDGDIIAFGENAIGIVKYFDNDYHAQYATLSNERMAIDEDGWRTDNVRPATEKEKQRFFDALAEQNKRWNAEKKVVEDVRWRAKAEGYYYRIDGLIGETPDVSVYQDFRSPRSDRDYETGNYFKTKEAAVIAGNQMADVIKNSKAE